MRKACEAIKESCIYLIADHSGKPLYIGETGRMEGLDGRYHGGTASALDAAMHGSGNFVYVACISGVDRIDVERLLIYTEKPIYNRRKTISLIDPNRIEHKGEVPVFEYLKRQA